MTTLAPLPTLVPDFGEDHDSTADGVDVGERLHPTDVAHEQLACRNPRGSHIRRQAAFCASLAPRCPAGPRRGAGRFVHFARIRRSGIPSCTLRALC